MENALEQLKKIPGLVVKENEPLKNHTTFQIGGPAKIWLEIKEPEILISALKILKNCKINYMMIGGGSNLLVSDAGFNGAVIKVKPRELKIEGSTVTVDSGYSLAGLLMKILDAGLVGLEFEAGVPGTVGGAIKGNAGTYGQAMDAAVKTVEFLNDNLEKQTLTNQECNFSYRHSIFKEHENWLVLSSVLEFKQGDIAVSRKLIDERIAYRMDSQPYGCPSAGCIFKNVIYTEEIGKKLQSLGYDVPEKFITYKKIPVAWLIENLGLKGKTIGKAQIAEKHANYVINLGGATADEIIQLISLIKQQVRDKLGIQLQEEVRYLGF